MVYGIMLLVVAAIGAFGMPWDARTISTLIGLVFSGGAFAWSIVYCVRNPLIERLELTKTALQHNGGHCVSRADAVFSLGHRGYRLRLTYQFLGEPVQIGAALADHELRWLHNVLETWQQDGPEAVGCRRYADLASRVAPRVAGSTGASLPPARVVTSSKFS